MDELKNALLSYEIKFDDAMRQSQKRTLENADWENNSWELKFQISLVESSDFATHERW